LLNFLLIPMSRTALRPVQLFLTGTMGSSHRGKGSQSMKLISHFHFVPMLTIHKLLHSCRLHNKVFAQIELHLSRCFVVYWAFLECSSSQLISGLLWLQMFMGWLFWIIRLSCKGNTELSQCLIKHHAMKMYGEIEVQLHTFLIFSTKWKWAVSFTPWPHLPLALNG